MGTFAETAIIDNHLLFAIKRKQTSDSVSVCCNTLKFAVSVFHLQQTKGSCHFPLVTFYVCRIPETWRHGDMETWRHRNMEKWRHRDIDLKKNEIENRSPDDFP
jgi:hypothetical protein